MREKGSDGLQKGDVDEIEVEVLLREVRALRRSLDGCRMRLRGVEAALESIRGHDQDKEGERWQ